MKKREMGGYARVRETSARAAITRATNATEVKKRPRAFARCASLPLPFTVIEGIFDVVSIVKLMNDDEVVTSLEFRHFPLGDSYEL